MKKCVRNDDIAPDGANGLDFLPKISSATFYQQAIRGDWISRAISNNV